MHVIMISNTQSHSQHTNFYSQRASVTSDKRDSFHTFSDICPLSRAHCACARLLAARTHSDATRRQRQSLFFRFINWPKNIFV